MRIDRAVLAAAAVAALCSFPAHAQQAAVGDWDFGVGITHASVEVCSWLGCLYADTVDPDTGLSVMLGRQIADHVAVEVGYADFGAPGWGDLGLRYRVDVAGWHAGLALNRAFFQRWRGYVKAGFIAVNARSRVDVLDYSTNAVTQYRIDADSTELMLGGGAELRLSDDWRLRFAVHLQELDDDLLDAREGTLQALAIELHRGF